MEMLAEKVVYTVLYGGEGEKGEMKVYMYMNSMGGRELCGRG